MIKDLFGSHTEDMKDEEIVQLFEDLYAPMRKDLHEEGADPKKIQAAEIQFDKGMKKLKNIYYNQLKRVEATYGTLPTQMHPQDFFKQVGPEFKEQTINQDWGVFIKFGQKYLDENDPEEGEKNKEFKRLADYYQKASLAFPMYGMLEKDPSLVDKGGYEKTLYEESRLGPETEVGIGGPKMNPKQLARYNADLKKRAEKMQEDLNAQEAARIAAESDRDAASVQLKEAGTRSEEIVAAAVREAGSQRDSILADADREADTLRKRAHEQIEQEREAMYSDMRREMVEVALSAASNLLGSQNAEDLDREAIDAFVKEATDGK